MTTKRYSEEFKQSMNSLKNGGRSATSYQRNMMLVSLQFVNGFNKMILVVLAYYL